MAVSAFGCKTVGQAPRAKFSCVLPSTSTVMAQTLDLKPARMDPTVQLSPIKHTGIYQVNFQTL